MSKIKADDLQKEIMNYLENYVEEITEDVKDATNDITADVLKEIKEKSPRGHGSRKNPYWRGWAKQAGRLNKGRYTVKVHNKTNYQLTHLLEFGHATRNGGRTKAQPHIRPVEEKYTKEYEDKITTVIKRRSKK